MEPLVSVVTITYNLIKNKRDSYIRQVIDCVQNQTYKNIEHIIIDGASTDGTLELLKDYPHLKIFSEPDKGVYDAMNKGVAAANGKYTVFLNSDDYWCDSRAVEFSVKALEENNGDFSYAPASYVDEDDNFLGYVQPRLETFFSLMPFCHQTMFTKTELINFDASYKSAADYNLIINLILQGKKGVYVPLNFTYFRYIGISCGKDDEFGNAGGKLSHQECQRALRESLAKFNVSAKDAQSLVSSQFVKRHVLEKFVSNLEPSLKENINRDFLSQKGNNISLGRLPKFRKITILFNARDIGTAEGDKWFEILEKHKDCEIFLFKESGVKVPDEYKKYPLYTGLSAYVDAFCSPVSTVPEKIVSSNIPVLEREKDIVFREEKSKNIIIRGSRKFRLGPVVFLKQRIEHGFDWWLLFNCIPLFKVSVRDGVKKFSFL